MDTQSRKRFRPTAFEIFFVILVFAVSIMAIFPTFLPRQGPQRQSQCINNTKQITTALMMYCVDNHERFPIINISDVEAWPSKLSGVDSKVYDCNTTKRKGSIEEPDYGFNGMLSGVNLNDVHSPSSCPSIADMSPNAAFFGSGKNFAIYDWNTDIDPRHATGIIMGFVDGHVQWFNMSDHEASPSPVNFLFKKIVDPYDGCGKLVYKGKDGEISVGNTGESDFVEKLSGMLAPGKAYGIVGEFSTGNWGSGGVQSVELVLGNEKDGRWVSGLRVGVDQKAGRLFAGDMRMPGESFTQLRYQCIDNSWYKLRAYIIRGTRTNTDSTLYAVMTGGNATFVIDPAKMTATGGTHAGLRVRGKAGKARVLFKNIRVYSYDLP